jgi:hypothetical protein
MGGLLAVAYAGDLPAPAQRLAHDTINAPAAGQPATAGPDPALSQSASPLRRSAGQASSRPDHAVGRPGRQESRGDPSRSPRQHRPSSSASGPASVSPSGRTAHGIPAQSGSPSGSPTPGPTQQPSPSASTNPPASETPSPSATPSVTGRSGSHHQPGPSGTPSSPPDHPPPPVAAAGAVRRAGSQPPRGLGPSHSWRVAARSRPAPGLLSGGNRPRWCSPR